MSGGETSADVQRIAEAERAELVNTLDRLRENLKPENVVDEVMASARISTSDISDKIWHTARANPIPAVLIGLGASMLLGVGQKLRSGYKSGDAWSNKGDPFAADPKVASDRGLSSFFAGRSSGGKSAQTASAGATTYAQIATSVRSVRPSTMGSNSLSSSAHPGSRPTSGDTTMATHPRSRDQLSGSLARLLDDQPLVLAALGVAVGAALGAAIPSTEAEGRLMGDASSSFRTRAQDLAQSELTHLKDTASATLGDLKQTAADHGVSTDNLSGLVQDAGAKVRDAAHGVADHAADSAGLKS